MSPTNRHHNTKSNNKSTDQSKMLSKVFRRIESRTTKEPLYHTPRDRSKAIFPINLTQRGIISNMERIIDSTPSKHHGVHRCVSLDSHSLSNADVQHENNNDSIMIDASFDGDAFAPLDYRLDWTQSMDLSTSECLHVSSLLSPVEKEKKEDGADAVADLVEKKEGKPVSPPKEIAVPVADVVIPKTATWKTLNLSDWNSA